MSTCGTQLHVGDLGLGRYSSVHWPDAGV